MCALWNLSCEEAVKRKESRLSACGALRDDEELVALVVLHDDHHALGERDLHGRLGQGRQLVPRQPLEELHLSCILSHILMQGLPPYQQIDLHTLLRVYDHVYIRKQVCALW